MNMKKSRRVLRMPRSRRSARRTRSSSSRFVLLLVLLVAAPFGLEVDIRSAASAAVVDEEKESPDRDQDVGGETRRDADPHAGDSSNHANNDKDAAVATTTKHASFPDDCYRLDENSVVLITGAAGFLGSELAIALHRVYNVKKLILIDHMSITPPSPLATSKEEASKNTDSKQEGGKSLPELHRLEYHRQRVFRVLQAVGSVANFYRVDVRANIPEYYQAGEVPLLRHIWSTHDDVTHVVHLASESSTTASIARVEPDAKAGLIETLLEEFRAQKKARERGGDDDNNNNNNKPLPNFVYASSSHVYDPYPHHGDGSATNTPPSKYSAPFDEKVPIDTPASFAGTSKLMDEILAEAYYDMDGLVSIGLRFFDVYGPWGNPTSNLHRLAEQAVVGPSQPFPLTETLGSVHDYIYVDDAVDAIMTAMQIQASQPLVVNVGTGIPTNWNQVVDALQRHEPAMRVVERLEASDEIRSRRASETTVSYASTTRATQLLGLNPQVPLHEGLERLLAWHYDRAFPYGYLGTSQTSRNGTTASVTASYGVASCPKGDDDCLLGAPVFFCAASDCANARHCWGSFWDDVVAWTRLYTAETTGCSDAVLYTVALDDQLTTLLPATGDEAAKGRSRKSKSFLKGRCNLAFVSDTSPLVRRLLQDPSSTVKSSNKDLGILITHGPWTIVPVSVTRNPSGGGGGSSSSGNKPSPLPRALEYLPKWSPSSFFTSKVAVYVDPQFVFDDVQVVLKEFENAPKNVPGYGDGLKSAALMVGRARPQKASKDRRGRRVLLSSLAGVQESAYRMIRIAAIDDMSSDGFVIPFDTSSFLVHRTSGEDPRLFRCDVLQELIQWEVADAEHEALSLQFVSSLHDLWSKVLAKKQDGQVWWNLPNMQAKDPVRIQPNPPVPQEESKVDDRGKKSGAANQMESPSNAERKPDETKDDDEEVQVDGEEGEAKDDLKAQGADDVADGHEGIGLPASGNALADAVGSGAEPADGEMGKAADGGGAATPPESLGDDEDEAESGTVVQVPETALQAAAAVVADARTQTDDATKTDSEPGAASDAIVVKDRTEAEKEMLGAETSPRRRLLGSQSEVGDDTARQDPFPAMPKAIQEAVLAVFGEAALKRRSSLSSDGSDASDSPPRDETKSKAAEDGFSKAEGPSGSDPSSDVWMGVLSSSSIQYFSRVVAPDVLGLAARGD